MNDPADQQALMVPRILWASLLMSQIAYLVIPHITGRPGPGQSLLQIFAGAAVVSVLASYFLPRMMARQGLQPKLGEGRTADALPLREMLPVLLTAMLIRYALLESVAIFGLVETFLSQDLQAQYPFAAVGIAGLLLNFPSEDRFRALAR